MRRPVNQKLSGDQHRESTPNSKKYWTSCDPRPGKCPDIDSDTLSSNILSDILSGILSAYNVTFYHSIWHSCSRFIWLLSDMSIWLPTWHILSHSTSYSIWQFSWHFMCHICWHSTWHIFWHLICYLTSMYSGILLLPELAFCLLFFLASWSGFGSDAQAHMSWQACRMRACICPGCLAKI